MYATALSDCCRILETISDTEVLKLRAKIHQAAHNFTDAISDYETLLETEDDPELWTELEKVHKEFKGRGKVEYCCFILDVSRSSTFAEIKKKYHQLSLAHHPDKNGSNKKSQEKSKQLNEAFAYFRKRQEEKK